MNYRIVKRDSLNWAIEKYQSGGTVSRGRYAGQEKQEKWDTINPVGYFPNLESAARYLVDRILGDSWPDEKREIEQTLAAIKTAKEEVVAIVKQSQAITESGREG